ncbi:MAG: GAF domain-containing protein [Anaerolineae bacterium]|nr:GAF domain-containing protein [Anaerolineae bacterium]
MKQGCWVFKAEPNRRGLLGAVVTLVVLLGLWWMQYRWFEASLLAEARGQQVVVARSVWTLQLTGLLVVSLGVGLAYFLTSRQTRLSQTVQTQASKLVEQEAQYRHVFENISEALVIREMDTLVVVDANTAYCQLLQTSRDAFIGQATAIAISAETHRRYIDIIKAHGQHRWESVLPRPDGTTLHLEATGVIITYSGTPHLLTALRDITERVQATQLLEQRVAERTRELETLLQISHHLTATLELKPLLNLILGQVRSIVVYTVAAVFSLVDAEQLELLLYEGFGPAPHLPQYWSLADYSFFAEVVQSHEPIIIPDIKADTDPARMWPPAPGLPAHGLRAWLGVPLLITQQVIGLMLFGNDRPAFYEPHHAALALAFANQAAIAIENARLYEQAQTLASLEERRHLARELHDSVSQALYGIALGTRTARMLLDRDPTKLIEPLDYIMNLAEAGLSEMRALIFELRPEVLEAEGLIVALHKQGEALQARHKLTVTTDLGEEPDVSLATKEALYRIAQEATHNVVKHAKASQIEMRLIPGPALTLEIKDNGQGFDPQQSYPGHLGLHSMRERVEKLGGSIQIESTPGQGTIVRVIISP